MADPEQMNGGFSKDPFPEDDDDEVILPDEPFVTHLASPDPDADVPSPSPSSYSSSSSQQPQQTGLGKGIEENIIMDDKEIDKIIAEEMKADKSGSHSSIENPENGVFTGFLVKQSSHRKNKWSQRWFVCNQSQGKLTYYKNPHSKMAKCVIFISTIQSMSISKDDPSIIHLRCTGRLYVLRAENRAAASEWLKILQQAR